MGFGAVTSESVSDPAAAYLAVAVEDAGYDEDPAPLEALVTAPPSLPLAPATSGRCWCTSGQIHAAGVTSESLGSILVPLPPVAVPSSPAAAPSVLYIVRITLSVFATGL